MNIKVFTDNLDFEKEFKRCSEQYDTLHMFVAWVGSPGNIIPYEHLLNLNVYATVGISFSQSHPDGIEFFTSHKMDIRIVNDDKAPLFHPKVYIFEKGVKKALIIGSSNFTYSGYYENEEANICIEGQENEKAISQCFGEMQRFRSSELSFVPNEEWLKGYKKRYQKRQIDIKKARVADEASKDENLITYQSWLNKADWGTYMKHVDIGINNHSKLWDESLNEKLVLLSEYEEKLKIPWKTSIFSTIENRRRILGIRPYGWLGHVGASGKIQQILANESIEEKKVIVKVINKIAQMSMPMNYLLLKTDLQKLVDLGPTIKVWSRFLAITRPALFCTISSTNVRKSLSQLLGKPQIYFETIDGYIALLQYFHRAPWFNSKEPSNKRERDIWLNRAAFLDVVFYL